MFLGRSLPRSPGLVLYYSGWSGIAGSAFKSDVIPAQLGDDRDRDMKPPSEILLL